MQQIDEITKQDAEEDLMRHFLFQSPPVDPWYKRWYRKLTYTILTIVFLTILL